MTWSMMDVILLAIFTEALVELWKKAGPLQPMREWLVDITPWLYSARQQTHLLMCPYCLSLYAGFAAICLYSLVAYAPVRWLIYAVVVHRMSNWLHLAFSLLRDKQLNIRIDRSNRR